MLPCLLLTEYHCLPGLIHVSLNLHDLLIKASSVSRTGLCLCARANDLFYNDL